MIKINVSKLVSKANYDPLLPPNNMCNLHSKLWTKIKVYFPSDGIDDFSNVKRLSVFSFNLIANLSTRRNTLLRKYLI